MLVAVFHSASGVHVLTPNQDLRQPGEDEAVFVARIANVDGLKSPRTAGLPFEVVDDSTLPARTITDSQGDPCPCRNAWRWNGGAVAVDLAEIPPNVTHLVPRLRAGVPDNAWPAGIIADINEAIRLRDPGLLRAVKQRLAGDLTLTPTQKAHIRDTFDAKRL